MKKIILTLILLMFTVPLFSIDKEQIENAREILVKMEQQIKIADECLKLANTSYFVVPILKGETEYIILTPEQIQQLKNRYLEVKQEIQQLYQQLP